MAFGQLGLGEYFWEMETREFLNAWIGHLDQKKKDYGAFFEIARFGSYYNVFSNDQAKALQRSRNPYLDIKPQRTSTKKIGRMLSGLAKAFKNVSTKKE